MCFLEWKKTVHIVFLDVFGIYNSKCLFFYFISHINNIYYKVDRIS